MHIPGYVKLISRIGIFFGFTVLFKETGFFNGIAIKLLSILNGFCNSCVIENEENYSNSEWFVCGVISIIATWLFITILRSIFTKKK